MIAKHMIYDSVCQVCSLGRKVSYTRHRDIINGDSEICLKCSNRARKGIHSSPATEIKKGMALSPNTQFKKGQTAWNKKPSPRCMDCNIKVSFRHVTRCRTCMGRFNSGKNHYNWKGGITSANRLIRQSVPYKQWRMAVFTRDRWTCVECGIKGIKIHADHIKPFSLFPELRFELSNGRTLCATCHKSIGWELFRDANPRRQVTRT